MNTKTLLSFLLILTSILIYSCKHQPNAQPQANNGNNGNGGNNGNNNTQDTSLCFERDILPIFVTNCAKSNCHDALSHEDGYVLNSYEGITEDGIKPGNASGSKIYKALVEDDDKDRMPKDSDPLPANQIALIRDWINRGAPNTTGCVSLCDSTSFTFSGTIQPMFSKYCKGCHNTALQSGGYSFDTYQGILVPVQAGRLLGALRHETGYKPMPQGGSKLSDCEIKQIEKWIAGGSPDN